MGHWDGMDKKRAKLFAWRTELPSEEEMEQDSKPATCRNQAASEKAHRDMLDQALDNAEAVAREIDAVWALSLGAEQKQRTAVLVRRVDALGVPTVVALDHNGNAAMRLAQLMVRYSVQFSRELREQCSCVLTWLQLVEQPGFADLVCTVVQQANSLLAHSLELMLEDEEVDNLDARFPDLGARLAALVDGEHPADVKEMALVWLSKGRWLSAVPTLRTAARSRYVTRRVPALTALKAWNELTQEDVLWQLQDLVDHPPPPPWGSARREAASDYAEVMLEVIASIKPRGGEEPLIRILRGQCNYNQHERGAFDDAWALAMLATGWPDQAVPWIERKMRCRDWLARWKAPAAVACLPPDLARSRLQWLVADADHNVAEGAQRAWMDLFKQPCPSGVEPRVAMHLLDAPPSGDFSSRVAVLRGKVEQARWTMMRVLLDAAPSREALVLLLYALDAARSSYTTPKELSLPQGEDDWALALLRAFGTVAADGMIWADQQMPHGHQGWMRALCNVHRRHPELFEPPVLDRMRALAAELFASPLWNDDAAILAVLAHLAPTPAGLVDRLWHVALEAPDHEVQWTRGYALTALAACPPDAALDGRLVTEARAARQSAAWSRLHTVVRVGLERKIPEIITLAREWFAELQDQELEGALDVVRHHLAYVFVTEEAEVRDALSDPSRGRFGVMADLMRARGRGSPFVRDLEAVLDSPAREGRSAAEAMAALVWMQHVTWPEPRMASILRRAPVRQRLALLDALHIHVKQPWPPELDEWLAECLVLVGGRAWSERTPEEQDWLERSYSVVVDRARTEWLGLVRQDPPEEAALYWLDEAADADDADDEMGEPEEDDEPQDDPEDDELEDDEPEDDPEDEDDEDDEDAGKRSER